jgi:hypothetical protein
MQVGLAKRDGFAEGFWQKQMKMLALSSQGKAASSISVIEAPARITQVLDILTEKVLGMI